MLSASPSYSVAQSAAERSIAVDDRAAFVSALDAAGCAEGIIAVARLIDFEKLAAFENAVASESANAFRRRVHEASGRRRPVARLSEDTYAFWIAGGYEHAAAELKALAYVLRQPLQVGGSLFTPTVKVGAAQSGDSVQNADDLLSRALAMLSESRAARDISFYSKDTKAAWRRRYVLEQELRRAVERQEMTLDLQPIVDVKKGVILGAEALLRWRHPYLGKVAPSEFVPVLEESRLMDEVGRWVLSAACRLLDRWSAADLGHLMLATNVSPLQFQSDAFATVIARLMRQHSIGPGRLEIEITETAMMGDVARARSTMIALRAAGVRLSIDDFGIGYSSLLALKQMPFDKLKLDRAFVADVDAVGENQIICRALIELAHGLGLSVVAEGVEREAEVEALLALGCERFQGFYFSRALDGDQFCAMMKDPSAVAQITRPAISRVLS